MYKYLIIFALLMAFAAAKPYVYAPYAAAYTAYSPYTAPVAYSAYTSYPAYSAYSSLAYPYSYASPYYF